MEEPAAKIRIEQEYEQWFCRQVQIGIDEADRGELISAEDVEAEFAALRASALRKLPGPAE